MAKLTTLNITEKNNNNSLSVTVSVNVTKEGLFTTTLSKEDVDKIHSYGIKLPVNRLGNEGYFNSTSLSDLENQIRKVLERCLSYKIVEEVPVIKYELELDNILALFLLPLFGAISDKHTGRRGRRTPFIVFGTIVAAIAFISLSLVDDAQLKNIDAAAAIDDPAALRVVYQQEADRTLKTPDGETFVLEDTFTEDEFAAITSQVTNAEGKTVTNHDYTNYVVPARQAYAHQTTVQHPGALIGFIALLLVVLLAMATFRSPAVALMPDVTIKPLRSKANAVINLMGTAGGILVLAIGMAFATSSVRNSLMSYTAYFAVIAGIMLVALLIFRLTVNEPKFVTEMQADSKRFGIAVTAMPKRLLSACISVTNFGSLTVRRKISSATSMMPAITAKYAV